MKRNDLITPEGTKDYIFNDCLTRRYVEKKIHNIFRSRGYSEVITPGLEFYDVFNSNSEYFPQENLYKLVDNKGRLLVVRPDSTIPVARVVATRLKDAKLPLRLYYNQYAYSLNKTLNAKSDESAQTGIELIGSDSRRADLEVFSTAVEVLSECDKENFRLEIGHIGFFIELVNRLNADDETKEKIRSLIEVKNYPALNDLLDSIGDNNVTYALKMLPRLFGGEEVFEKAAKLFRDDNTEEILKNLKTLYHDLSKLGYNGKITVDLGIVNRISYYTGAVMKGYLHGYGEAVLSGGRYDRLLSEFGYDVPATGFAVSVDAVADVIRRKNEAPELQKPDVIVFGEDGYEMDALVYAERLKSEDLIVENAVFDTLDEVREYARENDISRIVVINGESRCGEDE